MIKLSALVTSRSGLARAMLDERLHAIRRGDGQPARAFGHVGVSSGPAMVVTGPMAGRESTS